MSEESGREYLDPWALTRLSRLSVRARGPVEGSFTGMHKSPHRGASVEFSQYREYVAGDDISNVDWRVFARTDRFYVKEYEADTNLRAHLVLDCSGSMGFEGSDGTKLAYGKSLVALLAQLLIRQGDAAGLHCYNENLIQYIPPRTSPAHLRTIFDTLDCLHPSGKTATPEVLHSLAEQIPRRALVIVVSDFFGGVNEILHCFEHLVFRKHDVAAFHLLDDQEIEFELERPCRFIDMETGESTLTDPALIREEYRRCFEEYLTYFREKCLEYGVDYRRTPLSRHYEDALSSFLLERMRRRGG